jgi:hypothetical protein
MSPSDQIGERTVWNVADGEDVYALMQWQDKTTAQRAYFQRLCEAGKMFIGNRDRKSFEQWIAKHQFDTEGYLAKLHVYCTGERDIKLAQRLESQLQFLFRSAHAISYYRGEPSYSWLGKQQQGRAEICKQDYGTFELAPRMIQRLAPEDRVLLEAPAQAMPMFADLPSSPPRPVPFDSRRA